MFLIVLIVLIGNKSWLQSSYYREYLYSAEKLINPLLKEWRIWESSAPYYTKQDTSTDIQDNKLLYVYFQHYCSW